MPTTNARNLTFTTVNDVVEVRVQYNAVFTPFERHLAALGLRFVERIALIGVDPPGGFSGSTMAGFPGQNLPVTDGNSSQTIPRDRKLNINRAALQEDPAAGDTDEFRARIRIEAVGLPPS